jgi:hypothetical protein
MAAPIVIIGAGQAAASFISRHVALGNEQPLLLVGEESHPPNSNGNDCLFARCNGMQTRRSSCASTPA